MKKELNADGSQMPLMQLTLLTGFIGGVFGCLFGYLVHTFHFTMISPAVILGPSQGAWEAGWVGVAIITLIYGLLSMLMALLYFSVLKKKKSLWWGAGFGIFIFIVIFFILQPLIPGMKPLMKYDLNTFLTEICFFIVYGVFIGYSISYEYNELINLHDIKMKQ
jgi:hypothetical protein